VDAFDGVFDVSRENEHRVECQHGASQPSQLRGEQREGAGELLAVAAEREARQIDEKLFLETCATPPVAEPKTAGRRR
jgi:hypothetical protein